MKVRGTIAGTPLSAKLTALCWGVLTLLVPLAVSACTSSTSTTTPTVFSPSVTTGTAGTTPASSGTTPSDGSTTETGTPGVTTTPPPTAEVTVTQTVTVPPSTIPPSAPVTGGGGTAGFQDTLVLVLGLAAILVGAGGLAYRRWLGRGR